MKIHQGSKKFQSFQYACVVTLGVFDGVHLGHQQLLQQCKKRAQALKIPAVVYTFDPHPVRVLFLEACPPLIQTQQQKLICLQEQGIDHVIVEPFTSDFAQLSPVQFFEEIIIQRLHAREVIVGYDFTFGAARKGTTQLLRELGQAHGIDVHVMDAFLTDGHLVSSSVIRQQIENGHVELASRLLGRPFALAGTVIRGDGMGRQLGFPTANLQTNNELLPAHGVYVTRTRINSARAPWGEDRGEGKAYNSITNIGTRPTFSGQDLRIETHLFHFSGDLLGVVLELDFLDRLRPEYKFAGPEELVSQIHQDVAKAQTYFQEQA